MWSVQRRFVEASLDVSVGLDDTEDCGDFYDCSGRVDQQLVEVVHFLAVPARASLHA